MSGNTVIGALRVVLGLDSAEFSTGLKKSEKRLDAFGRSTEKMGAGFSSSLSAMGTAAGTFGKTLVAGLAIGGISEIVTRVREVARSVAEVGDEAKRAGVDVESFQRLEFVAEQNRIGVDALTDGLKELNLRADEFIVTGKGSAAEAFQRLGFSAESLKEKLKDPSELFTEIIGKLGQLDQAAQIRIADEIFGGTGGEKFVQLIEQGEQGIRATIQTANELGIVMDEDLIARAAEVDRQFHLISQTVGTNLKSAIVSAAASLSEFIDGFREFENQRSRTLQGGLADLGQKRLDIETQILKLQDEQRNNRSFLAQAENRQADATIAALREQSAALNEQEAKILGILESRTQPMARSGNDTWTPPVAAAPVAAAPATGGRDPGGRTSSAVSADRERQSVTDLIAALEEELRLVGATDEERRASTVLRQAGAAATEEERQKILALNEAIHRQEAAQEGAADAAKFFQDAAYDAFSSIIPKIETGNAALDSFVNSLIQAVAQAALLGTGPFGGLGGGAGGGLLAGLGSLMGFANGGSFNVGGAGGIDSQLVAFRASPNETVSVTKPGQTAHSRGGGVADVRVYVDQDGNWKAAVEKISYGTAKTVTEQGITQYDKGMPGRFNDIMERHG